jgi:ATP-dependent DNA ligase
MLYAFDLLELNGKDLRPLPLCDRKAKLGGAAGAMKKFLERRSAPLTLIRFYLEHTECRV